MGGVAGGQQLDRAVHLYRHTDSQAAGVNHALPPSLRCRDEAGRSPIDLEYLAYLIIGTVFFTPFIFAAETGGQIVSQDRERYGVMKSIYLSKASLTPYLFGRLLAELGLSVIATAASAIFAFTAFTYGLGLPVQLMLKDAVKFVLSILAVYLGAAALYYLLPSINLLTNKLHWSLTYYVLGFLYLAGDVLFPVSSLNQLLGSVGVFTPGQPGVECGAFCVWSQAFR
jgi:hypothetical protein